MRFQSPSWRLMFWPTVWTLFGLALLIGLGVWQLERRAWKLALLSEMTTQSQAPPVQMDALLDAAVKGGPVAYRPVIVSGRFDHDHELYLYVPAATDKRGGGPGVHVLTPLLRVSGPAVLVDRGYVPDDFTDPKTRTEGQVQGLVTVRGVAREPVRGGPFTPRPDPEKRLWFSRDLPAMEAALGQKDMAPFFIEADKSPNPGGWPRGGQTLVTLRNEHLGYAVTWFGLAAALAGVYLVYLRRARSA